MTDRNPYAQLRPYYKGHSREEDEKLAQELFYGTSTIDIKTGRSRHDYLLAGSPDECRAFEALERLLLFSCGDFDPGILGGLLSSLDRGGSFGRRLVFEKKRKRPADSATDLRIALYIRSLHRAGWKIEAAVKRAMNAFGLSRKTVFKARKRIRRESPWLEV